MPVKLHLSMSERLHSRVREAAAVEGIPVPEYLRRAALAAAERTEALAARRARQSTGGKQS